MTPRDNRVTPGASPKRRAEMPARGFHARELRGMLGALDQLGYDMDRLLDAAGLERRQVEDPDAYIPSAACTMVFARAREEARVPNLALQLALHTPVGAHPLLDYLVVSCDSVGQGLQRLTEYLCLVNPGISLTLRDDDDPPRLVVDRASGPFEIELTVSMSLLRMVRESDDQLNALHISFRHKPDQAAEYVRVFDCPVRTGASWDGWALSHTALRLPLRRRDPALRRWLDQQAAAAVASRPRRDDFAGEVRRVLATHAMAGGMQIEQVARRLATTPRTLQRRLARAGTTFDELRDDVRRQAARGYLLDTALTIAEIAYLLGYSEPAAFHRAFRRWYGAGATPQSFRSRNRAVEVLPNE